jgi:CheY-like chemotaxis protein
MTVQRRSVLVVDDDRAIVDALTAVFEDEGLVVLVAYDGLEALEVVERRRPSLVLSDLAMPGLDGVALARRVRAERIPVVLLSAAMSDPRLPGVPFIAKPFDLDLIVDVVSRALDELDGFGDVHSRDLGQPVPGGDHQW